MLMKKKEMSKKRKRKADIDIINDNDDIIDQLLADMRNAAEVSKSGWLFWEYIWNIHFYKNCIKLAMFTTVGTAQLPLIYIIH